MDYDDEDMEFEDVELINDLGWSEVASGSDWIVATGSNTSGTVDLGTIHNDIQLLTVTVLFIYIVLFVLFIVRKWR